MLYTFTPRLLSKMAGTNIHYITLTYITLTNYFNYGALVKDLQHKMAVF